MTTQQLESFLAVAENLSFARAAEALNLTQSAVSRQIHALESELDTKLFLRTSRSVALTPAGMSFHEDAKAFMVGLRVATDRLKHRGGLNIQLLTLGFSSDIDCALSAQLLKKCREQLPKLHPVLRVIPHRAILSLFFQGGVDVLFGFQDDVPDRAGVAYLELLQTPICCVVSSGHRYAERLELHEAELYGEQMILCNTYALPSQAITLQNRMKSHFLLDSIHYCDNPSALLALIEAGYGFGILPEVMVDHPAISAVPLMGEKPVSFGLFYQENAQSPQLKEFVSLVKRLKR